MVINKTPFSIDQISQGAAVLFRTYLLHSGVRKDELYQ